MNMAAFELSQFEDACEQVINADASPTDGKTWELFVESHGVTIYRHFIESSGLYEYRINGILDDVAPDVCAQVYMDIDYRRTWDSYINELVEVKDPDGKEGVYWQINFPYYLFMSNRDYVYKRELRKIEYKGHTIHVVLAASDKYTSQPDRKGVIRVEDYFQTSALMTDGKVGTKAYMHYYDNPGGSIPKMLINWAAKTGVPGFLSTMQVACRGYPEYLKKLEKS